MNCPIVTLEVQGMKQKIMHAFASYQHSLDEEVDRALTAICTPEYLQAILHKEADAAIRAAIEEEVRRFFAYGEGRSVIAESVRETLAKKKEG